MAKAKSVFVCSDCGYESPKWLGKCPSCNSWNTFYEEKIQVTTTSGKALNVKESAKPMKLNSVEGKEAVRTSTGISELASLIKKSISSVLFSFL